MPIGYLISVSLIAACTLFALAPPRVHQSSPSSVSFWFGYLVNELPFIAFYWVVATTLIAIGQGDAGSPVGWASIALAVVSTGGLGVVAWRGLRARHAVEDALRKGLGSDWRGDIDPDLSARLRHRLPIVRIVLAPFFVRRFDVVRTADISYGDAGKGNLLDIYRHRSGLSGGPTLVYLHGGAFRRGKKNREARPLIYRLASQGWLCISVNYRLIPDATFPDQLIDVKKVVSWAREHAGEYGGDPDVIFVAGSSAGGHLASIAALTPNVMAFQPGFERADTSVTAAISLYGYYGSVDTRDETPSSPMGYVGSAVPPFFVAHGDNDTLSVVEDARGFVTALRSVSPNPVVYAELPGAQHVFDLFHSIRFDTLVDAIEAFASCVRSHERVR